MSLKKYMFIDLLITGIIGMAVEFFGVFMFNKMIYATIIPYAVSLLIMMIATTRWRSFGLILIPFMALATVLSGRFINPNEQFRELYNIDLYLSLVSSLSIFSLNYFWFKIRKEKNLKETRGSFVILSLVDIVFSTLVLIFVYFLLTTQNLIMAFPVWSIFAYALLIIGTCILFSQGVLIDVKENLKNQHLERIEEEDFQMRLDDEEIEDSSVEKGVLECKK